MDTHQDIASCVCESLVTVLLLAHGIAFMQMSYCKLITTKAINVPGFMPQTNVKLDLMIPEEAATFGRALKSLHQRVGRVSMVAT